VGGSKPGERRGGRQKGGLTADDVPLDIVLHTPGGLVLAALQIAKAIRRNHLHQSEFMSPRSLT